MELGATEAREQSRGGRRPPEADGSLGGDGCPDATVSPHGHVEAMQCNVGVVLEFEKRQPKLRWNRCSGQPKMPGIMGEAGPGDVGPGSVSLTPAWDTHEGEDGEPSGARSPGAGNQCCWELGSSRDLMELPPPFGFWLIVSTTRGWLDDGYRGCGVGSCLIFLQKLPQPANLQRDSPEELALAKRAPGCPRSGLWTESPGRRRSGELGGECFGLNIGHFKFAWLAFRT